MEYFYLTFLLTYRLSGCAVGVEMEIGIDAGRMGFPCNKNYDNISSKHEDS